MLFCKVLLLVFASCFLLFQFADSSEEDNHEGPTVKTRSGLVRGTLERGTRGDYYAFRGIRYAEPPVGRLRFARPVRISPWTGVADATTYRRCHQLVFFTSELITDFETSEDCLAVNVYSQRLPTGEPGEEMAVMVFIHGGAFYTGDGSDDYYGPDLLVARGVVLVTLNYRLGPLGFFSLGDDSAAGNQGLWDQRMALEWVRENVGFFGGDAEKVTIFGESAGSMSVLGHLLSPRSKGLFRSAIAQSGSISNSFMHSDRHPSYYGRALADSLGCRGAVASALRCLRRLDPRVVMTKNGMFADFDGPYPFRPCVDDYSSDPFFPTDPNRVQQRGGNHSTVPLMIGATKDEGLFAAAQFRKDPGLWKTLSQRWDEIGPLFLFGRGRDDVDRTDVEAARYYRKRVFGHGSGDFGEADFPAFVEMAGDSILEGGNHRAVVGLSARQPVYQYVLTQRVSFSVFDLLVGPRWLLTLKSVARYVLGADWFERGVCHADDIFLLFNSRVLPIDPIRSDSDLRLSDNVLKLWTDFAKHGDPTPDDSLGVKWTPVTEGNHKYLNIAEKLKMEMSQTYLERMSLWEEMFQRVPPAMHLERVQCSTKKMNGDFVTQADATSIKDEL